VGGVTPAVKRVKILLFVQNSRRVLHRVEAYSLIYVFLIVSSCSFVLSALLCTHTYPSFTAPQPTPIAFASLEGNMDLLQGYTSDDDNDATAVSIYSRHNSLFT
jgi:hypothetical protein